MEVAVHESHSEGCSLHVARARKRCQATQTHVLPGVCAAHTSTNLCEPPHVCVYLRSLRAVQDAHGAEVRAHQARRLTCLHTIIVELTISLCG